ncbi:uncharacterized protein BXZ73DRAFT_98967 [Epithele typhae]|uniref:uncharacterized protein n=1 Tax=Epithele typhae TaxID=378194 RepID=UPI0020077563|nr:uncharacterized protein BXZ73DRAFT_98967 [Epithele typhae]KAH9940536.1 hypothetical protein BXZ73DRAFT_98967 [Epithele typhae]
MPPLFFSDMDSLPRPIRADIFRYACTDGGPTGAALARTSRAVAAETAPFRFHSLHLTSLRQIGQLLLCHERLQRTHTAPAAPPRRPIPRSQAALAHRRNRSASPARGTLPAHHLLLNFLPGECDAPKRAWRAWDEYSTGKGKQREELADDERAWAAAKASWDAQFVVLVPWLFALVAPTLETMVVLQSVDLPLPYVLGVDGFRGFPRLHELALLANDSMFVHGDIQWSATPRGSFDTAPTSRAAFDQTATTATPPRGSFESDKAGSIASRSTGSETASNASFHGCAKTSLDSRGSFESGRRPFGTPSRAASPAPESDVGLEPTAAAFPALTHLHVVYEGAKATPWEKTLPVWSRLAPGLTHLRVSQASKLVPEMLDTPTLTIPRAHVRARSESPHPPPTGPLPPLPPPSLSSLDLHAQWPPSPRPLPRTPHHARSAPLLRRNRQDPTGLFPSLRLALVQPFVRAPVSGHAARLEAFATVHATRHGRRGTTIVLLRGRAFRPEAAYWADRLRWAWAGAMCGDAALGVWGAREREDEGEWAYERRKRREVAEARERARARAQEEARGKEVVHRGALGKIRLDGVELSLQMFKPLAGLKRVLSAIA